MKKITKYIQIPKGKCSGKLCGECIWMDRNSSNSSGEYWCAKYRKYYPVTEDARYCKEFEYK